jgi:PAS domain S-box-containing protein
MNHSNDALFHLTMLGVAFIALDGHCLKINDTMYEIFGYNHEEISHNDFLSLILPDNPKESMNEFVQLLEGKTNHFTSKKRYIHKMGNTLWVSRKISIVRTKTNEPQHFIVQIQDITEHKRAEIDLAESEAFSRNLLDQALVGICLTQETKIVHINLYLARLFGYPKNEFLQLEGIDLIVKEDYIELAERARKTLVKNNDTLKFNIRGIKKNQNIIYLEGNCKVITYKGKHAVLSTVYDMTYKKQTEELLIEKENRYQKLLKFLPEPIIVHGDGIILYANTAAVHLVKAKVKAELIGKSIFKFLHKDYHSKSKEIIQRIMIDGKASEFEQRSIYCVTGELIETEVSSIRIDNDEQPVILSVLRNITERKKAEEKFIQSEKLSAIGQLAAGVAHEIRNPLTSLKGFTQLLKSKFTDQEIFYFDIMQQELDRINQIVNDFMTLAKPNLHEFNNGSIVEIFKSVIAILETQAIMTNVNIKKEYTDEVPSIYCDENQLKQVFLNIIKNAIEAMPDGGDVTITIKEEVKPGKLHIQIKDQGIGIPHSLIEKLGEPFFTTKKNGTGLGLMITQRIIAAHGGTFHISSIEKKGTIVDVYLPNISQLTVCDFGC